MQDLVRPRGEKDVEAGGHCRLIRAWDSDRRQVREQAWCEVGDKAQRYCWEIWEDGGFTQTNPITGIVNSRWFLGSSGEKLTHWKRPWCWETVREGEGDDRGSDGWVASSTQWT